MDDGLVCLTGLMLLVDPSSREHPTRFPMTPLILSLYLMTQCQMKLHHPVTSLAQTLNYIKVARQQFGHDFTLNQLLLKLAEHKILKYTYQ